MASYRAPIDDMRFVLHEIVGIDGLRELTGFEEATPDIIEAVLEEAAKFSEERLFPLNRSGDEEGCQFADGVVTTPAGFKEAYAELTATGWTGIYCDPQYGGQGLPGTLSLMVDEIFCACNLSFSMYVALTHGVYNTLVRHGSEELKNAYLPNLVSGLWTGTMCLTEPQCGTDLGLIKTRAKAQPDGSFRLTGTKIFISAGEHDLSENIIHLVLARRPDAASGTRGVSLFLVPKYLLDESGNAGDRNTVSCGGIEHKMGIRASSTCVINFDEASGYLVGTLEQGMRAMFTMMNAARLEVGVQGAAIGEAAYQGAVTYARERVQGRSLKGVQHPEKAADPIIVHPDIRRMLLTGRAYVEGSRALGSWVAKKIDISERHADERTRREAEELVALLTPIVKAFFTDIGLEVANLGMQVYGGHGYIREHGMEQYVRDARITQIYEGTNGIQALDLVGRKLSAHMGRYLRHFFHPVEAYLESHAADGEFVEPLAKAFGRLQRATAWLAQAGLKDPEQAGAAASEYLRLFALVALGYMWIQMAHVAQRRLDVDDDGTGVVTTPGFYQAKIDTCRFFMQRLLPQTSGLFASIMCGSDSIMSFDEAAF